MSKKIYRLPNVLETTGMSRSALYRAMAAGKFPSPVRLTERCVGWREDDVLEWLESRERVTA